MSSLAASIGIKPEENCMLQYSQMPSKGWSRTNLSFRFAMIKLPLSGLVHILARLAGLVRQQVIRECHAHGRLHVGLEWISRMVKNLKHIEKAWFPVS